MAEVIVRIEHIRAAGICVAGARTWAKQQGIDFRDFLNNGLPASRLEQTGEHFALKVVEIARREAANGKE